MTGKTATGGTLSLVLVKSDKDFGGGKSDNDDDETVPSPPVEGEEEEPQVLPPPISNTPNDIGGGDIIELPPPPPLPPPALVFAIEVAEVVMAGFVALVMEVPENKALAEEEEKASNPPSTTTGDLSNDPNPELIFGILVKRFDVKDSADDDDVEVVVVNDVVATTGVAFTTVDVDEDANPFEKASPPKPPPNPDPPKEVNVLLIVG